MVHQVPLSSLAMVQTQGKNYRAGILNAYVIAIDFNQEPSIHDHSLLKWFSVLDLCLIGGRWYEASDEDGLISASMNTITLSVYPWCHLTCQVCQRKGLTRGPGKSEVEVETAKTLEKTSEKNKLSEELEKWCKKCQQTSL